MLNTKILLFSKSNSDDDIVDSEDKIKGTGTSSKKDEVTHQSNPKGKSVVGNASSNKKKKKFPNSSNFKSKSKSIVPKQKLFSNISGNLISRKYANYNFTKQKAEYVRNSNINVKYHVLPNSVRLLKQALCFKDQFLNTSGKIIKDVLGPQNWENKLKELYIYSYFKCLYYGLEKEDISMSTNIHMAFIGHATLYNLLYQRRLSGLYNEGISVTLSLDVPYKVQTLVDLFIEDFPFLDNCVRRTPFETTVYNGNYERFLLSIKDSIPQCYVVQLNILSQYSQYCDHTGSPYLNSHWRSDYKGWKYCIDLNTSIFSLNYYVSRANCIVCDKIDEEDSITYYDEIPTVSMDDGLDRYEAHSITGLECTVSSITVDSSLYKLYPPFDDLLPKPSPSPSGVTGGTGTGP